MSEQQSVLDTGLLLIHGDESYLVDRDVAAWRAAAPVDIEVLDSPPTVQPVVASLVEVPLFADARAVLVRNLALLRPPKRGAADAADSDARRAETDMLLRALPMRAPTTSVCFVVRGTVPANSRVLAAIRENGGTVLHHPEMKKPAVRQWLDAELRRRGLRLPPSGTEVLLQSTDGTLDSLAHELDKLFAHGPVSADQLRALVAGSETLQVYEVVERLAGATPARGAVLLSRLLDEGTAPQWLLAILSGQLRDLLLVHGLVLRGTRGQAALASSLGKPPWMVERLLRQVQVVPAALAMAWLRELQRIDAGMKNGEVDDAAALRSWGLEAADALARRRPRDRPRVAARTA